MNLKSQLQKPFTLEDIRWKIQRSGRSKDGKIWALVVPYLKTDAIENRLDEVVGPENWRNEPFQKGANGGLQCGLSIRIEKEWVTKWDGSDNTQFEAVKGGMSDAFKRSAKKWGVGRYLSRVEPQFADVYENSNTGKYRDSLKENGKKIPFSWNPPGLPAFCFEHPSTPTSAPSTRLSDEEWHEAADEFRQETKTMQQQTASLDDQETEIDQMKDRITAMIPQLKQRRIRLQNGRDAFLYATKQLFASQNNWQVLHDLEAEVSKLLAA